MKWVFTINFYWNYSILLIFFLLQICTAIFFPFAFFFIRIKLSELGKFWLRGVKRLHTDLNMSVGASLSVIIIRTVHRPLAIVGQETEHDRARFQFDVWERVQQNDSRHESHSSFSPPAWYSIASTADWPRARTHNNAPAPAPTHGWASTEGGWLGVPQSARQGLSGSSWKLKIESTYIYSSRRTLNSDNGSTSPHSFFPPRKD